MTSWQTNLCQQISKTLTIKKKKDKQNYTGRTSVHYQERKKKSSDRMREYFDNLNKCQRTFSYGEEFLSKIHKKFLQISKKRQPNKIQLPNEKLGASLKQPPIIGASLKQPPKQPIRSCTGAQHHSCSGKCRLKPQ